jgi:hypothetical protein
MPGGSLMKLWGGFATGNGGNSPSGFLSQLKNHHQSPREAGLFLDLDGYLDRNGKVAPVFANPALWQHIGHNHRDSQPSDKLIVQLCQGMNALGGQLTRTGLFRAPKEFVIALPCELSEALTTNPAVAYKILMAMLRAYVAELQKQAAKRTWADGTFERLYARTLTLAYFHGTNDELETHIHLHVLTFSPALDLHPYWRSFENTAFVQEINQPGGGRSLISEACIAEAALHGYQVEMDLGMSSAPGTNGAKVTCPNGYVIYPGSVARKRGAVILCNRELKRELGAPPLTDIQLELVMDHSGQTPPGRLGTKPYGVFLAKLKALGLLEADGRIKSNLLQAMKKIDSAMAIVQASLQDLPFVEGKPASDLVRYRREKLHDKFPNIRPNDLVAKIRWIKRYEEALELVGAGMDSHDLQTQTLVDRETFQRLRKAFILEDVRERGLFTYRLSPTGEERLLRGRKEREDIEKAVPLLQVLVSENAATAPMVRGRLMMAGVDVQGDLLIFRRLGRVVAARDWIRSIGIESSIPCLPDTEWWKNYRDRQFDLPSVLAELALQPDEIFHPRARPDRRKKTQNKEVPLTGPKPYLEPDQGRSRKRNSLSPAIGPNRGRTGPLNNNLALKGHSRGRK